MRELERDKNHTQGAAAPLVIVGPGRVGRSLALAADRAGIDASLAGRGDAASAAESAGIALLTVPDSEIVAACEAIAEAVPPLRLVGHTSGATGLEALSAAARRGASTFSLHPLQTVPDEDTDLIGASCAVAGSDDRATAVARSLAERLGMRPFAVPEEARAAYHAAACMASNFLVALEESAAELLARAGVEGGRELLAPLVLRTAANWSERGGAALTGPIARGDEATVARHVEALEQTHPELVDAYRALAERARALGRVEVPAGAATREGS
jgi:predicted short-subunit dehydrogenase-like oxidoreductase (DUF2520 family)